MKTSRYFQNPSSLAATSRIPLSRNSAGRVPRIPRWKNRSRSKVVRMRVKGKRLPRLREERRSPSPVNNADEERESSPEKSVLEKDVRTYARTRNVNEGEREREKTAKTVKERERGFVHSRGWRERRCGGWLGWGEARRRRRRRRDGNRRSALNLEHGALPVAQGRPPPDPPPATRRVDAPLLTLQRPTSTSSIAAPVVTAAAAASVSAFTAVFVPETRAASLFTKYIRTRIHTHRTRSLGTREQSGGREDLL